MIRETTPSDFDYMPPHTDEGERAQLEHTLADGDCRTVEVDGVPIAIFGVYFLNPKVGHVWIKLLEGGEGHAIKLVRAARQLGDLAMNLYQLHRLQTQTMADDYATGRWLGLCGFVPEAVLVMAGPNGEDLLILRKLKEH